MATFAETLLSWHERFGRKDLPWQQNASPYSIWVSEIMLQQTQVTTVIPYYRRFIEAFPDARALADAPLDEVLAHWSGLGYYARARNLHRAAQAIRDDHGGAFPREFNEVLALPGIGRSTAGAILGLARGERHPILDGNAKRVLARYHAIDGWPGKSAVSNKLWALAEAHTPEAEVAAYTQAIMDLGATVCTRASPSCRACPLSNGCKALALGAIERYPGRRGTRPKPLRHTHMVLAHVDGSVYLERRPAAGIWGGLWSLPELQDDDDVIQWCRINLDAEPAELERWQTLRHSFTHYDLDIEPIAVRLAAQSRTLMDSEDNIWYDIGSPPPGGMAAPVSKLIDTLRHL